MCLLCLFYRLKTELFHQFLVALCLHEHMCSEVARLGLQGTDAIVPAGRITFVLQFESANIIIGKEIFQDHLCLRFAVAIAFYRQCHFHIVVKMFRQFGRITRTQCNDYIIDRALLAERSQQDRWTYDERDGRGPGPDAKVCSSRRPGRSGSSDL